MTISRLHSAVNRFAALLHNVSDDDLDLPWAWQSYDFEGVRFAFFRTYEELNGLALSLASMRVEAEQPVTPAQRILSLYHAAFRDLEATLARAISTTLVAEEVGVEIQDGRVVLLDDLQRASRAADPVLERPSVVAVLGSGGLSPEPWILWLVSCHLVLLACPVPYWAHGATRDPARESAGENCGNPPRAAAATPGPRRPRLRAC